MIRIRSVALFLLIAVISAHATAEDGTTILLADGKFAMTADASWKQVRPRVSLIQHEFQVPSSRASAAPGRLTVTAAGGSIEANIERWKKQFRPDRSPEPKDASVEKKTIAGLAVRVVDLSGTFLDRRGPFAPAVERPGYRLLGAIIPTPEDGTFFVKFTGPEPTVTENRKKFVTMIDGLRRK